MFLSNRSSRTAFWLCLFLLGLMPGARAQSTPPSSPLATTTALHNFTIENFGNTDNLDGLSFPGPLTLGSDSNFYGVAQSGGSNGTGTVFQVSRTGILTVLFTFESGNVNNSGSAPGGPLIEDPANPGTFYGTTRSGGDNASGTIFQLVVSGGAATETVLHSFGDSGTDGIIPAGALAISGGVLYGTTRGGGANSNAGTVYAYNTANTNYTILHNFTAATDGSNPNGLVLHGTTLSGIAQFGGQFSAGTVWSLATDGSGFSPLYTFGGADGFAKPTLSLALAPDGTRYGSFGVGTPSGYGGIFQISPGGAFSVLHAFVYDFSTVQEGGWPGPVTLGADGNIYGQLGQTPFNTPSNQFNPSFDHRHFEVSTTDGSLALLSGPSLQTFAGYGGTPLTAETALTVGPDGEFYALENDAGASGYGDIIQLRPAPAHILTVSSAGDNAADPTTLRGAISAAQPGDAIVFSNALQNAQITLTQGELDISQDLNIVFTPTQAGNSLTIDATGLSRVFHISGGIVDISGLTLANGVAPDKGGGIVIDGGAAAQLLDVSISGCSATGSSSSEGGGLCLTAGDLVFRGAIANCVSALGGGLAIDTGSVILGSPMPGGALIEFTKFNTNKAMEGGGLGIQGSGPVGIYYGMFTNNQAGDNGGAIYDSGGQLVLENSTLSGNTANGMNSPSGSGGGGGLYNAGGSEVLQDDIFSGNAAYTGGALDVALDLNTGPGYTKIYFSTFSGNAAIFSSNTPGPLNGDGGAITVNGGHLDLLQSTIGGDASQNTAGNHAAANGGGIYVGSGNLDFGNSGLVTINDVTFYGNVAAGMGGGVFSAAPNTSNVSMRYSTVTNNDAQAGGGLYQAAGNNPFTVSSTIIAQNTLGGSGATATGQDALAASDGTFATGGSNLIGNGDGATGFTNGVNDDQIGSGDSNSVIDPLLFPLGNYGGSTLTRALKPGSPALQTSFNFDNSLDQFDQRGVPRANPLNLYDIGAAEHPAPHVFNDSYSATENTELDIAAASGVLANDYADDGETPNPYPLTAAISTTTTNGILTLNPDGSFSYTPTAGFTGTDSFTYIAHDPITGSAPATVTIFVSGASASPPTTAAALAGTSGNNGYYKSAVTVTLTATDPSNGAGGAIITTYAIDGGTPQTYSAPFVVGDDGPHTVAFASAGAQSGAGPSGSVTFNIDATPPTLTFGTPTPAPNASGFNNAAVSIPYTAADATSGTASALPGSPLTFTTEGAGQTQTVTVTDNAGNSATFTSPAVNIDLTPPVTNAASQNTPQGAQVTLTAADNLSGVAATTYTLDGGAQTPYTAPFTVTGNGSHTVTFASADKAGNTETAKTLPLTLNIAAPVTTATLAGPQGQNGFYTGNVTVTLSATSQSSTVTGTFYTLDGGTQTAYTTPFSVSGDAKHTLTFFSKDAAGNTEATNTRPINIDATPPVTNGAASGAQVTLAASDNLSGVAATTYAIDGGAATAYTTPFTVTGNGAHTVTFHSTDNAGNTETTKTLTLTFNIAAPVTTATLAGPQGQNGFYTGSVIVTLAAASQSSTVTGTFYTVDGGPRQTYSGPFPISGDALHTLTFFSTNAAGNAEAANTLPIKIDGTPPVTTATVALVNSSAQTARAAGATYSGPVQVTLAATDNVAGVARTTYALDGSAPTPYTAPFTVSAPGNHTLTFFSTDNAGNAEAPKTLTFTISSPAAVSVLHTFPAGLYLFSVPKDMSSVPLTQALSVAAPKLAVWQPLLAQYILTPTNPADALRPGQGYWARFAQPTDLYDLGTPTSTNQPFAIPIQDGWNMIGNPFPAAVSGANIRLLKGGQAYSLTDPVAQLLLAPTLYSYDEAAGQYQAHALQSDALAPYVGYWLFSRCDGSLLVSPP